MFIHLGGDILVSSKSIIAILNTENNKIDDHFLTQLNKNQKIKRLDDINYKSIIITDHEIFLSPISSLTLKKRAGFIETLN